MIRLLLLVVVLLTGCALLDRDPIPLPDACAGECGGLQDCEAAAARVEELGCAAQWGVDTADGRFLDLCRDAETRGPSLCPALIARASSCAEADEVSTCSGPPSADVGGGGSDSPKGTQ